ncbi:ATP-binding protein [Limosilactobacillus oris]|uniref:ATP-binding protein n=1 Tax=Limosilactobacillus oris TaxID=1632 RepID=UPI0022355304|nr:ATP-binding protein [Limosilactobacillus oris]MCW4388175.1 ATP-binding protein [Limosilactobacillus oris]
MVNQQTGQPVRRPLIARHLLVVGQTGSGKTTTTLALLNELQQTDQTAIILDPTGEYAQLPNAVTYRLGANAYLEAGRLDAGELQEVLGLALPPRLDHQLSRAINALRIQRNLLQQAGPLKKINRPLAQYQALLNQLSPWARDYDIALLPQQLVEEAVIPFADDRADYSLCGQVYDREQINRDWGLLTELRNRLAGSAFRELFDTQSHPGVAKTELGFVLKMFLRHRSSHRTLVIDLSLLRRYERQQGALISYLLKQVLTDRLDQRDQSQRAVKIVIDEAHRYLPTTEQELSRNGIFQLLREGRKVNLQLILTTQSPLDLPDRLRSQFAQAVVHRLSSQGELAALPVATELTTTGTLAVGEALLLAVGEPSQVVRVQKPDWL